MKTTVADAVFDGFGAEPERKQLPSGHNTVLPAHQLPRVFGPRLKPFPGHNPDKASTSDSHPRRAR